MNKIGKAILVFLAVLLYLIPMIGVIVISNIEKQSYAEDTEFSFEVSSYGETVTIERQEMYEYYVVDLKASSITYRDITVNNRAKLLCKVGDEISKGQLIADDGTTAEFDGEITDIEYGDKITLTCLDIDQLVLELDLPADKYGLISGKKFQNEQGDTFEIVKKSKMITDGMFHMILSMPEDMHMIYGQELTNYTLYTGTVYHDALTVEKNCVYQRGSSYYVRIVDENGKFVSEEEVKLGYADEKYVCVSGDGIEEGMYCDSGYADVVDQDEENQGY
ncbi:MAG: hypothetical protein K6G13_06580 [Agathobacter sp.]|uniref:hypothetical protein n=1 Tax=Agathobacter sp. TaxID=2021311 RepID=UPI00258D4146|nr:hypothetical protein [Agathobacter sp.]MCR5677683.1 hypothetical protein [Agathobacter sp.]